jgi:hypothetical protein
MGLTALDSKIASNCCRHGGPAEGTATLLPPVLLPVLPLLPSPPLALLTLLLLSWRCCSPVADGAVASTSVADSTADASLQLAY